MELKVKKSNKEVNPTSVPTSCPTCIRLSSGLLLDWWPEIEGSGSEWEVFQEAGPQKGADVGRRYAGCSVGLQTQSVYGSQGQSEAGQKGAERGGGCFVLPDNLKPNFKQAKEDKDFCFWLYECAFCFFRRSKQETGGRTLKTRLAWTAGRRCLRQRLYHITGPVISLSTESTTEHTNARKNMDCGVLLCSLYRPFNECAVTEHMHTAMDK